MPYPTKETDISYALIFLVGGLMSLVAGHINSIMLLTFNLPVSQMTGIASHISEGIGFQDWSMLAKTTAILLSFIFGAFISGLLIGHSQYRKSPSYGFALLVNACLLAVAIVAYQIWPLLSLLLTAVACGLQNALVASYKGLQIRTTHITGTATDIGVHLAHSFKNRQSLDWRAWLLICLLVSFILGGLIGILSYPALGLSSLWIPAVLSCGLGFIYLTSSQKPLET